MSMGGELKVLGDQCVKTLCPQNIQGWVYQSLGGLGAVVGVSEATMKTLNPAKAPSPHFTLAEKSRQEGRFPYRPALGRSTGPQSPPPPAPYPGVILVGKGRGLAEASGPGMPLTDL